MISGVPYHVTSAAVRVQEVHMWKVFGFKAGWGVTGRLEPFVTASPLSLNSRALG